MARMGSSGSLRLQLGGRLGSAHTMSESNPTDAKAGDATEGQPEAWGPQGDPERHLSME
jgi:hypothetical protein